MNATKTLSAVGGYLGAHGSHGLSEARREISYPAITITRQTGARALTIGNRLVERFQAHNTDQESPPWTLWENQLISQVLRESNLPERLAKYFPEEPPTYLEDTVEVLVGLHPSSYDIDAKCQDLIGSLCRLGHVVIVGRAANLLACRRPNVLHVRLVGSERARIQHLVETRNLSEKDAIAHMRRADLQRRRYAKLKFDCPNVDDPLLYDLVVNTDHLSDDGAASTIETALKAKVPAPVRNRELAYR